MTRPVKPKPKNKVGVAAWGLWAQAPPNWFLGFGLTGLVIRMGPWDILQECCMMHLVIMKALHDFHASCRTSDSMLIIVYPES